ncbi:2'-5' RNA ligase family protein [Synechococcus sp. Nb3U1]|uniref:2'-5' RNA ligase family protein n=1 Tax=Synechococcus sp. Nb3U1 TaxID=1914529 RepID=UPI001F20DF6E|nr:2'-5' RNA ligase family protein [Synechococcus sp. Nb3U1]MCF2971037.1 2'-5' RNA ligase family protein [Synechococcus sp. Nb3U1]
MGSDVGCQTAFAPAATCRLFLALLPPPALQEQVRALQQEFVVRFASRAALRSPPHITLVPPFEWPGSEWSALIGSLQIFAAGQDSIAIELSGFGAFAPRVIYIHVDPSEKLQQLQSGVQAHLLPLLNPKNPSTRPRPFVPHMTVAFRDLTPHQFRAAWPEFQSRQFQASFWAADLTLLQHDGRQWQVTEQFSLVSGSG